MCGGLRASVAVARFAGGGSTKRRHVRTTLNDRRIYRRTLRCADFGHRRSQKSELGEADWGPKGRKLRPKTDVECGWGFLAWNGAASLPPHQLWEAWRALLLKPSPANCECVPINNGSYRCITSMPKPASDDEIVHKVHIKNNEK